MQIWNWRNEAYSNKKLQENPVVVKSHLDSNSKRFRDTVIREIFKLKPETQIQKTQPINRVNYIQQYNEVIEKL